MTEEELAMLRRGITTQQYLQPNQWDNQMGSSWQNPDMMQGGGLSGFGGFQGILGGIGREGGGLIGQGFGRLFGNSAGNVDFGGGNMFVPSQGFMSQQQAPSSSFVGAMPMQQGFSMSNFLGSLF